MERSLPPHARPCARLMQVAVPLAAFEALSGDPAEALRVAKLVLDHAQAEDRARAAAFAAAVVLYAGDPGQAQETIAALPADAPHRGELRWLAGLATGRPAEPLVTDWGAPFRGVETWLDRDLRSGRRVAVLAQEQPAPLGLVRLAARKIDGGRGVLQEWLRWGDKHDLWRPTSIATTATRLRDVAEAVGEPALAREQETTRRAFHEALARRDIAVPLAVIDGL